MFPHMMSQGIQCGFGSLSTHPPALGTCVAHETIAHMTRCLGQIRWPKHLFSSCSSQLFITGLHISRIRCWDVLSRICFVDTLKLQAFMFWLHSSTLHVYAVYTAYVFWLTTHVGGWPAHPILLILIYRTGKQVSFWKFEVTTPSGMTQAGKPGLSLLSLFI